MKSSPIPFESIPRYCSNGLQVLLGAFLNISWHRLEHFLYISLKAARSCLLQLKIQDGTEKFKHSGSFSNYDQTIPLKVKLELVRQSR
jgi:hypothetical protein